MSAAAAWITDNFDAGINWIVAIAMAVFPLLSPDWTKNRVRLCDAIYSLSYETIKSIAARNWTAQCFS